MIPRKFLTLSFSLLLAGSVFAQNGSIAGKVTLNGKAPADKTMQTDADPKCKASHPSGVAIKNYVVDAANGLANVFVYVKDGLAGKKFPAPTTPLVLDQQGCMYNPMVLGIQTGQPLIIQNSDDTMHNVHALAKKNAEFNVGQPTKGQKSPHTFDKPEVFVKFKCDVHPWMSAYVGVVDHPFFAVSGADGSFKIAGLPDGEYTLVAVHPKAGESQPMKVKVSGGEAKADFIFVPKV
jgi:plastocyanin